MKQSRRIRLDLNTSAEMAIHKAIQEVEQLGADVRLTNAVMKLQEAKEKLSNYIDAQMADVTFYEQVDLLP